MHILNMNVISGPVAGVSDVGYGYEALDNLPTESDEDNRQIDKTNDFWTLESSKTTI